MSEDTLWSAGRYESVADRLAPLADTLLDDVESLLGPVRGQRLLDVGSGTGNVAVAAARRGAVVTALDPAGRLLEVASARAAAAGVTMDTVTGDAQALPFPDGSFDAVVSCVGVVFAPDRAVAAAELRRVASPGGVVSVLAWEPARAGDPFAAPVIAVVGAPPVDTPLPADWGRPEIVGPLLAPRAETGDLTFRRGEHRWPLPDVEDAVALVADSPLHVAVLAGLDDTARERFWTTAAEAFSRHRTPDGLDVRTSYLVTTLRVR